MTIVQCRSFSQKRSICGIVPPHTSGPGWVLLFASTGITHRTATDKTSEHDLRAEAVRVLTTQGNALISKESGLPHHDKCLDSFATVVEALVLLGPKSLRSAVVHGMGLGAWEKRQGKRHCYPGSPCPRISQKQSKLK